jgi:hypothetical protein
MRLVGGNTITRSRRMRWVEHVVHIGEIRNAYNIIISEPEGKKPIGKPRNIWDDKKKR